jgi:hypothetical protein
VVNGIKLHKVHSLTTRQPFPLARLRVRRFEIDRNDQIGSQCRRQRL